VRVFKTKDFAKFARKEQIDDDALCDAIARAERGLIDAALGSNLIKQRVPRKGQGRSGGYRTLIAYRHGHRAVFLHGFGKSAQDNLVADQLAALKQAADVFAGLSDALVKAALEAGKWKEIRCDGEKVQK
jgi:hypothetical protein